MRRTSRKLSLSTIAALVAASVALLAPPAAADEREQRNQSIVIRGDQQFTPQNGIRSGSGTKEDPYVISGWDVYEVNVADTDKYLTIVDNTIDRLVLNWNGDRVRVVNNSVGDLRVNQNVKRTGGPTSGIISHNRFRVVGQLRHFDGEFAYNRVGPTNNGTSSLPFFLDRAVNFDGFHGSRFHHNTIFGYVEVRLHGHHHGSSYEEGSHYHGPSHAQHGAEHHEMAAQDHTKRFHEVFVYNNTIQADGPYALLYTDSNHRGNDRTATSETNEQLNRPHQHWTRVHLTDNRLVGAGIKVDQFNARDERHTNTNRGTVEIARNDILVRRDMNSEPFQSLDGVDVYSSHDLDLSIVDNRIAYETGGDVVADATERVHHFAGVSLWGLDKADVLIARNSVAGFYYGVSASDMTASVYWRIVSLATDGVTKPVAYDSSVKNPPEEKQ